MDVGGHNYEIFKKNLHTKCLFIRGEFLGSKVDKLSKTSNTMKFIESDIQNIKTPRIDDLII